ncbi:hypothetical protein I3842_01G100700 [Carya illinoinensis]|uniref:40S ribosomal protein S24 n=1 Tax=Carya illinoinensis TaxID=32201 RepID=A0A922K4M4_CARIL|nr:hypothetical protein I3842_01G100700 [Carya illinoinensis]
MEKVKQELLTTVKMVEKILTIRTRKFMTNRPNVSKTKIKEKLARMHEVKDLNSILFFRFRTHFGGGKSSSFGLIYDFVENEKKYKPKYRLISNRLDTKVEKSRKQLKERKNRAKKIHGVKKLRLQMLRTAGQKEKNK